MTQEKIACILELHSIPYKRSAGRIYADSMLSSAAPFEVLEDVTDWTFSQLAAWLGY